MCTVPQTHSVPGKAPSLFQHNPILFASVSSTTVFRRLIARVFGAAKSLPNFHRASEQPSPLPKRVRLGYIGFPKHRVLLAQTSLF